MKWYQQTGLEGDTVISSRVRLARNVAEYPFPCRMTQQQRQEVNEKTRQAIFDANAGQFEYIDMQKLTPARAMSLAERHLISPEFAQERKGRALLLGKDERVSIMLGEEDHIRIQALSAGLALDGTLKTAWQLDDVLDEKLRFAFDERLGYLTQCPTNLGTGLRASLMLFLPAVAQTGAMHNLAAAVAKLGITIRGTYGEGSDAKGTFFQISNQVTLGVTEQEAVKNLMDIAGQIIAQERSLRENLKSRGPQLEDRIFRSYGILRNARLLSADEFMSRISDVRLGVVLGMIPEVQLGDVDALLWEMQPATLMANAGRNLDAAARDTLRAETVRETLK